MSSYNLSSPNSIQTPCDLTNLDAWVTQEAAVIQGNTVRSIILQVCADLAAFVAFPARAELLWRGSLRKSGVKHQYPDNLIALAKKHGIPRDGRENGPAIMAYLVAGGHRVARFGSTNAVSIHHLYSGKFPYLGHTTTLHAPKHGAHFTQSAGLVAIHPIADAMCDEYPFFSWFLRAKAFLLFGYDPDGAFSPMPPDAFGFQAGSRTIVHHWVEG